MTRRDPFPLSHCAALVLLGCLAACPTAAGQTVVVNDTFDMGAATPADDPDDPLDVEWSNGAVIDDSAGIGDGNALERATGDIWAMFNPVTIDQVDDFARLSFDFRFIDTPSPGTSQNSSNGNYRFRIGFTDEPDDRTGYIMRVGVGGDGTTPGATSNGIGLRQQADRAGPYEGGTGVPAHNDTFSITDTEPHSASVTLTRILGETTEDGVPTGSLPGVRFDGMVDNVSVSADFLFGVGSIEELLTLDHIYIDNSGSPGFIIDNVLVETGITGPPATPGDVNGDEVVDLDDLDVIRSNFLEMVAGRGAGDLTGDGLVGFQDFRQWKDNSAAGLGATSAVPEPASACLLIFGAAGLLACSLQRHRMRR